MPAGSDPNCPGRRLTTSMWGSRFADSLGRPVPRPRIPAAWGPLHHPPRGAHHPQRLCRHVGVHLRAHQLQRASNGVRRAGQRHGLCLAGEWWLTAWHAQLSGTQARLLPRFASAEPSYMRPCKLLCRVRRCRVPHALSWRTCVAKCGVWAPVWGIQGFQAPQCLVTPPPSRTQLVLMHLFHPHAHVLHPQNVDCACVGGEAQQLGA